MSEPFGVRGRVVGEDGQPLTGARVILGPELRTVETDGDGRFAFDGLEARNHHRVWAREGDFYSSFIPVNTEEDIELRLRRGATFIATVLADGVPLADATVALTRVLRTVTDERGVAVLRGVPPESFDGRVAAEGRATHNLSVTIEAGGMVEQTIELVAGAEISGRVIDQSGAPVREELRISIAGESPEVSGETSASPDGEWKLSMRAGRYQIQAAASPRTRRVSQTVAIECDGKTPQRDLVLQIASTASGVTYGRIAGVVVDEQGRPAHGARVHVARPSEDGRWSFSLNEWLGYTDRDGRFETAEIGATRELDVGANWEISSRSDVSQRAAVGDLNVKLVLPRRATLVGRALLDGAPVPYFGVCLFRPGADVHPTGVRSDDGRFALPHVPPGTQQVTVLAPGTRRALSAPVTVTANETIDLGDIDLMRGYRVSGFVRDRSGAPVADARVVVGRRGFLKHGVRAPWSPLERLFLNHHETQSNTSGFYVLEGLGLTIGLPEIVQATHPTAGLSIVCELPKSEATLDFTLLGRGRIEGESRSGPSVVGVGEPMFPRHVSCDRRQFAVDVPPGDYEIWSHFSDKGPATKVTVLDGQTVTVTLVTPGSNA